MKRARGNNEKIDSEVLKQLNEDIKSRKEISDASDKELEEILSDTINEVDSIDNEIIENSGLDKRNIGGLKTTFTTISRQLRLSFARKARIEGHVEMERAKLNKMENDSGYSDEQRQRMRERLGDLEQSLRAKNEEIKNLKFDLSSQITSIKESIAKVFDSRTSLGERIRTLFREQGITIVSVLTAFGMVIGFIV